MTHARIKPDHLHYPLPVLRTTPVPMDEYDSTQSSIHYSDGGFHVFLINSLHDTTNSLAFPYALFPQFETGNHIDAINWSPPMTITWDTSLFHAPYLPYNQGHFGMAIMDGLAFSQFGQSGQFGVYNMLIDDSVNIDFLWDYLFPFAVYFGPVDDTGITGPGGIGESLGIWPNPATDKIRLHSALGNATSISIIDIAGRQLFHQSNPSLSNVLDISMLPPGRYFIRILTAQNQMHHGTFEKIP